MTVYVIVTHSTGDGVESGVYVRKDLDGLRDTALDLLDQDTSDDLCDACGERDARGQERPAGECQCECHGDSDQAFLETARQEVMDWDGAEPIEVNYFDGNMGRMILSQNEVL
jgi:hypothetical protein